MSAEATYAVRASPLVGSSVGGEGKEPKVNDLEDGPFYHRSTTRTLYSSFELLLVRIPVSAVKIVSICPPLRTEERRKKRN